MLTIRKPIFDTLGNVAMRLKHYSYEIVIKSKPEPMDKYCIMSCLYMFGEFERTIANCNEYKFNKKEFMRRCYRLVDYMAQPRIKWFIRNVNVEDETIKAILENKAYFYAIEVIACKYGIGLGSVSNTDADEWHNFSKLCTLAPTYELVNLINRMIRAAYDTALEQETTVLSSPDINDYNL